MEICELQLYLTRGSDPPSASPLSSSSLLFTRGIPFSISLFRLNTTSTNGPLLDSSILNYQTRPPRLEKIADIPIRANGEGIWSQRFACAIDEVLSFEMSCDKDENGELEACDAEWWQSKSGERSGKFLSQSISLPRILNWSCFRRILHGSTCDDLMLYIPGYSLTLLSACALESNLSGEERQCQDRFSVTDVLGLEEAVYASAFRCACVLGMSKPELIARTSFLLLLSLGISRFTRGQIQGSHAFKPRTRKFVPCLNYSHRPLIIAVIYHPP